MAVRAVIAHAPWAEGRKDALSKMLASLDRPEAVVFSSPKKEHAFEWAQRIWRWCARQNAEGDPSDWLILNDDLDVHPRLCQAVEAAIVAVPGRILCFHTNAPIAPELARMGQRWLESYWLTGPAYVLPFGFAGRLVEWCNAQGAAIWLGNEDSAAMEWMWSVKEPAWHSIPALVQHRTEVPSTLGYDKHPMRTSLVPWGDEPVTDPEFWSAASAPVHVECSWMSHATLESRASARASSSFSGSIRI